eukprot:TRINITY_DN2656_c0_g1_i1.p1 TRINITY_DN2656_c0_g1~~TRINITY_DN2656_c0_g1_i1.p1  ORF type:complete len:832 (-),score=127.64 TRINITY_DN2656_c0_g1_i1:187-2682(-)
MSANSANAQSVSFADPSSRAVGSRDDSALSDGARNTTHSDSPGTNGERSHGVSGPRLRAGGVVIRSVAGLDVLYSPSRYPAWKEDLLCGIKSQYEFLLVSRRRVPTSFTIPAGKYEQHVDKSSFEACALREICEEAGVTGEVVSDLGWHKAMAKDGCETRTRFYAVLFKQELEEWEEAGERQRSWCRLEDARKLVAYNPIFTCLFDKIEMQLFCGHQRILDGGDEGIVINNSLHSVFEAAATPPVLGDGGRHGDLLGGIGETEEKRQQGDMSVNQVSTAETPKATRSDESPNAVVIGAGGNGYEDCGRKGVISNSKGTGYGGHCVTKLAQRHRNNSLSSDESDDGKDKHSREQDNGDLLDGIGETEEMGVEGNVPLNQVSTAEIPPAIRRDESPNDVVMVGGGGGYDGFGRKGDEGGVAPTCADSTAIACPSTPQSCPGQTRHPQQDTLFSIEDVFGETFSFYRNQVGGHFCLVKPSQESQRITFEPLHVSSAVGSSSQSREENCEGVILKPFCQHEHGFYVEMAKEKSPLSSHMPKVYGTKTLTHQQLSAMTAEVDEIVREGRGLNSPSLRPAVSWESRMRSHDYKRYIVMEDLANLMDAPCILDLKMGYQQRSKRYTTGKRERCNAKAKASTSHALGFRICGLITEDRFHDKYWGRRLPAEGVENALADFFVHPRANHADRSRLISSLLSQLHDLQTTVASMLHWRFWNTSLLFLYDGKHLDTAPIVRVIDFAHCTRVSSATSDDEYACALGNVALFLETLLEDGVGAAPILHRLVAPPPHAIQDAEELEKFEQDVDLGIAVDTPSILNPAPLPPFLSQGLEAPSSLRI